MADDWTCGKGLAKNAALPAKLADVADAMACLLEAHTRALDVTHEDGRKEYDAYRRIAEDWRGAAPQLHAIATQMAGYRDLAMGPHDEAVMAAPPFRDAFERFVVAERELAELIRGQLSDYGPMLDDMKRG
jgi:hypothetical protein